MLKGFEDITVDLDEKDIPIAEHIARGLNQMIGKESAISNKRLRNLLKTKYNWRVGDVKFRKIIQYIRANNLVPCLCSNSQGYYKAANDQEWEEWKESFRQRIRQMQFTLHCAEFFNDGHEKL